MRRVRYRNMPDPARYRRIADHHIERLIHKYNPADQEIIQEYIDMVRAQQGTGAARVRSIVEILFTWRQVINKPFADWNLKGVFKGINTVRTDRKPNTSVLFSNGSSPPDARHFLLMRSKKSTFQRQTR
jgi:hypothetical protein